MYLKMFFLLALRFLALLTSLIVSLPFFCQSCVPFLWARFSFSEGSFLAFYTLTSLVSFADIVVDLMDSILQCTFYWTSIIVVLITFMHPREIWPLSISASFLLLAHSFFFRSLFLWIKYCMSILDFLGKFPLAVTNPITFLKSIPNKAWNRTVQLEILYK